MRQFQLTVKKSKFIAFIENIKGTEQATAFIEQIKKLHKKATHICFAYKTEENNQELVKFDDDKEPSGTAGRPILSIIEKKGLKNTIIVVVRYFGGIKLGSSGLLRAYLKSAIGVSDDYN